MSAGAMFAFSTASFSAEIWLLNDAPETAQETVRVSLEIAGKTLHLIDWTAAAAAGKNQLGPTVNLILPDTDAAEMTLRLEAGAASSAYRLRYRMSAERSISRQMNV